MRYLLLLIIFLPGCALFTVPEIHDPTTNITYKGKEAVRVYAHQKQQDQLQKRWDWLIAESSRPIKNEADAIGRNMLLQSVVLNGIAGSSGGEYFQMLAKKFETWGRIGQTGLAVLGPALVHYLLYGGDGYGSSGDISSDTTVGGDLVVTTGGPPSTVPPVEGGGGFYPAVSLGGVGNLVGSPEAFSAFHRSTAGQNQGSGTLQLDNEKPVTFKDTTCSGGGCLDDADGGNDTSLF
jgi:hypothetical protein